MNLYGEEEEEEEEGNRVPANEMSTPISISVWCR